MAQKDYTTIKERKACDTVIKGSRFIGIAAPIHTEEELRTLLSSLTTEFSEATHYCYAAIYGGSDKTERSSDNGEPSGTAGKPILTVIRESGITDTAIVVIRYFGGTLLGTGGLVHAYSESASAVLNLCEKVEKHLCNTYTIKIPYSERDRLTKKLDRFFAIPPSFEYDTEVRVTISIRVADDEEFNKAVTDTFGGRIFATPMGTGYR